MSRAVRKARPWRRRTVLYAGAVAVIAASWGMRTWAEQKLSGAGRNAGLLQLQLSYNSGAAFSLGADHPTLVLVVTGALCSAIAVAAWWAAAHRPRLQLAGLAAVLGGAVANLSDRLDDGVVTDYLHSGWWPTFNLPDIAIVVGAALLVLVEFRRSPAADAHPNATSNHAAPGPESP